MKLFLDTADFDEVKKWYDHDILDGITTNPTHLSKVGGNPLEQIKKLCKLLPHKIVNVQVTEESADKIYKQAQQIAKIADNIIVKIPCHPDYYATIKKLVQEGIKINITLVFSLVQGLMMAKLGVAYISPFVGRLDDSGGNGTELLVDLRHMIDYYQYETAILAASVRDYSQVRHAILAGADIITISAALLEKIIQHPLTDRGMQQFHDDWLKLHIAHFP